MAPPKDFDYAKFKKLRPSGFKEDPKLQVNMTFLHNHYIHYPKLSQASKDNKVMYDRVNMIRQMTAGLKKTRDSINATIKLCKPKTHDKFKVILVQYLELLRKAERDRQQWIKEERQLGNTKHLDEMIVGPGLDDVVRI